MAQFETDRKAIAARVKKFESTAEEIHAMARELHRKMEKLHSQAAATRAGIRAARERVETKAKSPGKPVGRKLRKAA